jgi:hypothetical protein
MPNTIVSTTPVGGRTLVTFDHTGPATYATATGDVINASDLGYGGFEFPDCSIDTSNQFQGLCQLNLGGSGNAVPSFILRWYPTVTQTFGTKAQVAGAEALNGTTGLNALTVRIQAFMV